MHATELVYRAIGMPLIAKSFPVQRGACALCRHVFHGDGGITVQDAIKPTFTNRDLLDPRASCVCVACAYCLSEPKLRRKDFVATLDSLQFLKRSQLAEVLLNSPSPPFVFCVGLSHKKHLVLRTRVNLTRDLFYIQFEEESVWFQPNKHGHVFASVQALRKHFRKGEIETGNYLYNVKLSPDDLFQLESIIKPYRGSSLFKFLLHTSLSEEKKDG